jgi:predicted DNA-binding transcriptional regulator AlpA
MNSANELQFEKAFVQDKGLAFVLDISTSSVWRLVKKGVLPPPVKVNGLTRFDLKKSVDAFRAAGEAKGAQ